MVRENRVFRKASVYIYLLPAFILMAIFVLYPIINTIITSLKLDYRFLSGDFIEYSLKTYKEIMTDKVFHRACLNTLFLVFICVPVSMLFSLGISLLLNSIKKLNALFVTLFYLPQVTNVIAAGMVFILIFDNNFGLINTVSGWLGLNPIAWISGIGIAGSAQLYHQSYMRCLFVLFVYQMWSGLALKVLLFLSGLQNINKQYYQVAQIDGTSKWNVLRKVTLPLLSPTMIYIYVTSSITAFKTYSAVVALFGDSFGPKGDSSKMMITIVGYIMDSLGNYLNAGAVSKASAAGVILMVVIFILTIFQLAATGKRVHYK